MEYSGQNKKYPVNRPLTEAERADQLKQKKRVEVDPHYNLSVIRINSTYLELVDKYYAWKGAAFLFTTFFAMLMSGILLSVIHIAITHWDKPERLDLLLFVGFVFVVGLPSIGFMIRLALLESFTYTHYPIILNRKTRMVHVFRRNGTVLSVPWDDLFFTLNKSTRDWNVRGHVLEADGVTVKETFAFPKYEGEKNQVISYWEFVRRYMEEGPAKLIGYDIGKVDICHPLVGRKEGFKWGLLIFYSQFATVPVMLWLLSPWLTLCGIARYLANLTCDIPVWPKRVLDACVIEPNDPYERDARHNPPSMKRWT